MGEKLRCLFFGSPEFSLASFAACLKHCEVLAVVSQPDRPRGRGKKFSPTAVKERALELGLKTFSPPSLRKESDELESLKDFLAKNECDFVFVTAYGNLLPNSILEYPRLGSFNLHASLLPKWRGAAPIQRSLEAGDTETGVCIQKMVQELDAGDVVLEQKLHIEANENAIELSERLSELSGECTATFLKKLHDDEKALLESAIPQDNNAATFARKLSKQEGYWQRKWSHVRTHNCVRAFAAWPGVKAQIFLGDPNTSSNNGAELKLLKTSLHPEPSITQAERAESLLVADLFGEPGEIVLSQVDGKTIALLFCGECGEGKANRPTPLIVERCQVAGKAPVNAAQYFSELLRQSESKKLFLRALDNSPT